MAVSIVGTKFRAWNSADGKPLAFGKVYTYQAGTNTPKATYTTEGQETENPNPVTLNAAGYADIYLDGSYKIVVKDADDVEVNTTDPVSDPSQLGKEWVNQKSATQVSANQFKVSGNATDIYTAGRKLKLKDSSFIYGEVTNAQYLSGETFVTISADDSLTTQLVSAWVSLVSEQTLPDYIKKLVAAQYANGDESKVTYIKSGVDSSLYTHFIYVDSTGTTVWNGNGATGVLDGTFNKSTGLAGGANKAFVLSDISELEQKVPVSSIAKRNTTEQQFNLLGSDYVNQVNATWFEIDGHYAYSISKGSYDAANNDIPSFDIFDISDPSNVKRVSTNSVGVAGTGVRGLAKYGNFVYLGSWSTVVYIWNVADPENPFQVGSFNRATASRLQMLHVISGILCCPGWNGTIDFYDIRNPKSPVLLKSFDESANGLSMVQMIPNGNHVWCIGYTSATTEYSLLCFDLSVPTQPQLLTKTAIQEIRFARYGVIEDNRLYVGGFASTSRVCVVDVSTSTPVLIKELSFNLSSFTRRGDYLVGFNGTDSIGDPDNKKTVAWDISDLDNPVKTVLWSDRFIFYPQNYGSYIVAFINGLLGPAPGAAPNDSDQGEELAVIDFNPLKIDGMKAKSIKTTDIYAEKANARELNGETVTCGKGGVRSSGPISGSSMTILGFGGIDILGKGKKGKSLTYGKITGDISAGVNLFKISTGGETGNTIALVLGKLKLYGIINQAAGGGSKMTYEELAFSGLFNGNSDTWLTHMPPTQLSTVRGNDPGAPVFVVGLTVTSGVLYVSVTSAQMNVSGSMLFAELETIDQIGREANNYLVVDYA